MVDGKQNRTILICSILIMLLPAISLAGTVELPKTGQITSYAPGDDGDIQAGVAWPSPRFIDNGDGTVTDELTGLMWTKDANLSGSIYWADALPFIESLNQQNYLGYYDWRLSNILELESLVDIENSYPALPSNNPFLNLPWACWSSTNGLSTVWALYLTYGVPSSQSKTALWGNTSVWPVRSLGGGTVSLAKTGQITSYAPGDDGDIQASVAWPSPRFIDNGDGTVTDELTGLMWTKDANLKAMRDPLYPGWYDDFFGMVDPGMLLWGDALQYVEKLNQESYLGFSDWRLPNIREVRSLVDHEQPNLTGHQSFENVQHIYWVSNSVPGGWPHRIFYAYSGHIDWDNQNTLYYVWPVRSADSLPVCNPPAFVYADNSDAFGLFEGIVEYEISNEITTGAIDIQATDLIDMPFLKPKGVSFWVSIDDIVYDPSNITLEPNEEDVIGSTFANLRLIAPGTHASYSASFCQPGVIKFDLGLSETAIALTLADAIISIVPIVSEVSPSRVLTFAAALNDIPLMASAHTHINNAINAGLDSKNRKAFRELRYAGADLRKLAFDREQRAQLVEAYADLGTNVTIKKLFKALLHAPVHVFKIFGDVIVLGIQTDWGTAGTIRISMIAS